MKFKVKYHFKPEQGYPYFGYVYRGLTEDELLFVICDNSWGEVRDRVNQRLAKYQTVSIPDDEVIEVTVPDDEIIERDFDEEEISGHKPEEVNN
jgi:hypothetical protein